MPIHFIPAFADNYIYVVESANGIWIIDPGDAQPVFDWFAQRALRPTAILCTHHHADHTGGVAALAEHFTIPVYGANTRIPALTHPVAAGYLRIDGADLNVMEIPGHTLDHIAFLWNHTLFCGDTLFAAGCGRLFEGTATQMFQSLQQLAALPGHTAIYCAHEYTLNNLRFAAMVDPQNAYVQERQQQAQRQRQHNLPTLPSSIDLERASNPFLRCTKPALIASAQHFNSQCSEDPLAVFTHLRQWKDQFS